MTSLGLMPERTIHRQLGDLESIRKIHGFHMLKDEWTLLYDIPSTQSSYRKSGTTSDKDWRENQKKVATIKSIEEFWAIYKYVPKGSELSLNSNYYFFKSHIEPAWEDENNKYGGRLIITVKDLEKVDTLWLHSMLACIGCECPFYEDICGILFQAKKQHRIVVWTKDASNPASVNGIIEYFKNYLHYSSDYKYNSHDYTKQQEKSR